MLLVFLIFIFIYDSTQENVALTSFNCHDNEITTHYSSSEQFCSGSIIKERKSMNISLLQRSNHILLAAIKCSLKVSTTSHFCGEFSHNHIIEAMSVSRVVRMSGQECSDTFLNNRLVYENKIIKVKPNFDNRSKFFLNGTVILSYNLLNEQTYTCVPSGIYVGSNYIASGYQSVELSFFMSETEVLKKKVGIFTLNDNIFIGNCTDTCFYKDETFVIQSKNNSLSEKIRNSNIRFIKTLRVDKVIIGSKRYIKNVNEGIFIMVTQKQQICFNSICIKYYETEIQDLYISSTKNIFPLIEYSEIDYNLEMKLELTSESRILLNMIENQPFLINICKSLTNPANIHNSLERYGGAIEFRGELVVYHTCKQQIIYVKLGDNYPCYKNVLVFSAGGILKGISPFTRLVMDIENLSPVSCSLFPTFFSLGHGKFIVNLGKGLELKFFNVSNPEMIDGLSVTNLFTDDERVQSSLILNRRFEEIKTNLFLSQLTQDELTKLKIVPGFWNNFASFVTSLDIFDPMMWFKIVMTIFGIMTGFCLLFILVKTLIIKVINIKCFERHIHVENHELDTFSSSDNE
jgi:hypothetical protein